ncbi:hypothetical protein SpiBuddy_1018 [Sphaerochaeta globosa str. Buddy]|uniref:Uncharacterized protein n=1 Tax=Sphaerochaeta globosa (strain ATCC BAA-1886 / DSM 22777 / Buddy) TaxID=158189 RepID=F0RYK0_SPHGB|nr:hypothetical protein SpiBuddy_1018 [Sphaerochaeta globosa str. Buddy]
MGRDYHIFCSIALSMPYYLTTNFNILLTVYQHCAKEGLFFLVLLPWMYLYFHYRISFAVEQAKFEKA